MLSGVVQSQHVGDSRTQEGLGWVISGSEGPGDGINVWKQKVFFCHSILTYDLPRKLQWYWTYLGLSVVPAQPV